MNNWATFVMCERHYLEPPDNDTEQDEILFDERIRENGCQEEGCDGEFEDGLIDNEYLRCAKCGATINFAEAFQEYLSEPRDYYDDEI